MTQEPGGTTLEERRFAEEIRLREEELRLRREEFQHQKRNSAIWVPIIVALIGLLGALLAATLSGYFGLQAARERGKGDAQPDRTSEQAGLGAPSTSSPSFPTRPSESGVVDAVSTDTVEFSCRDSANPGSVFRMGLNRNQLPADQGRILIPDLTPGIHLLWWSVDKTSAKQMCEVVVSGTVQYRDEVSSMNGSLLLRVK